MEWFLENRPSSRTARRLTTSRGRGAAAPVARRQEAARAHPLARARRERVPLAVRHPRAVARLQGPPVRDRARGRRARVGYEPAESTSGLFGGNSNWRGPVWFPMNYLLIEALQKYHHYYGDEPQGGVPDRLGQVDDAVGGRLRALVAAHEALPPRPRRPSPGRRRQERFRSDPNYKDLVTFYEYFNGDTGAGLGASHQTGWTASSPSR
jgi:hypothetical protein